MPHREADKEAVKRAEARVATLESIIGKIKSIKSGDRDAVKVAMDLVRDYEFDAARSMESHLEAGTPDSFVKSHGFMKQRIAYQNVIMIFEAPDDMISTYTPELEKWRAWLAAVKSGKNNRAESGFAE